MTPEIRKALESIQLLADLPPEHLDQLVRFSMVRSVRAGETIFCQGEPSPYCFGVVSGEVTIERSSNDRRFPPKVLGVLGPGSLFGESAFFTESPRVAMATATKAGELVAILGSRLREWVKNEPSAGVPLAMGLLRNSIARLHHTSHELSTLYGIGRLLGSAQPFEERLSAATDFLRSSLSGVDGILLYRRNPYWEEYEALLGSPASSEMASLPLNHGLIAEATDVQGAFVLQSSAQRQILAGMKLPWAFPASAALIPLVDRDTQGHPLQGFLLLASQKDSFFFTPDLLLMLSAVADPFAEALSRRRREEDATAQNRLDRNRQTFGI